MDLGDEYSFRWAQDYVRAHAPELNFGEADEFIREVRAEWVAEREPAPPIAVEAKPEAAHKPQATPEEKAKAARKKHKLSVDVGAPWSRISKDWRRYPGMPDLIVCKNFVGIQQRTSRRHGTRYELVPFGFFNKMPRWQVSKRSKRTNVPAWRVMYDCGFWKKPDIPG
jgi:hypothetical protein